MSTSLNDLKKFVDFAARELGLRSLPKINFVGKIEDNKRTFGHFFSHHKKSTMTVRIIGRHPIDVMRTIVHELIHYKQRVSGSSSSEQMKEDEANAHAGRIMRKFDAKYPKVFKDKPIMEDGIAPVAANATGAGIANFDPLMNLGMERRKPLRDLIRKDPLAQIKKQKKKDK